ncbi:MAG: bifunctional PIG-L family deacetylase/class I SAM-dependent methyltransferase [Nocardioides sp.]
MVRHFAHDGPSTTPARVWAERPEWSAVAAVDLDGFDEVVVVSAHPDDETLGAGGLMATAAAVGVDVHLIVCTSGEGSHPHSPTHGPELLARRRKDEVRSALRALAADAALTLLHLPDGQVEDHEQSLVDVLVRVLGDARRTLLVAPWRHDGHRDHDAAGRAAAAAAHRTGATLWEYPVWWWHWAIPEEAPWADLRRLDLSEDAVERRSRALVHHRSQIEPLSEAPGDEALLRPAFLEHFAGCHERFVLEGAADDALDSVHRGQADPWGVDHHWYEQRKRAVTLALLPRARFTRTLEIGCSVGALTADLADRSDRVVAVDSSAAAVVAARRRLASSDPRVDVRCADVTTWWPDGTFDLIVVSEVGYFLSPHGLDTLIERIRGSLTDDGVVLLCHWRHDVAGWVLDGPQVHEAFERAELRPVQARHTERDFAALALCAPSGWPGAGA